VEDFAAGGVDEDGARFRLREFFGGDEVFVSRAHVNMDGEDVGVAIEGGFVDGGGGGVEVLDGEEVVVDDVDGKTVGGDVADAASAGDVEARSGGEHGVGEFGVRADDHGVGLGESSWKVGGVVGNFEDGGALAEPVEGIGFGAFGEEDGGHEGKGYRGEGRGD